jgi:endonuclease/exonuclease/phosphatase family metal-dependent hydrolase
VYGEAQTSERHKTWDLMKFVKSAPHLPWVCMDDFNEVLHQSEHVGVQERSHAHIAGFREMVDVCRLHDLGYEGRSWTFEKKVSGGSYCRVRLDRVLASTDWSSRFPAAQLTHLSAVVSDHILIQLQWNRRTAQRRRKGRFKYEVMWETRFLRHAFRGMEARGGRYNSVGTSG